MAKTSLLMFPIYGMGAILPEISGLVDWWLGGERLDWMDRVIRHGILYTVLIFMGEYLFGSILKAYGICPWDYTGLYSNVNGLIRLDFLVTRLHGIAAEIVWYITDLVGLGLGVVMIMAFNAQYRFVASRTYATMPNVHYTIQYIPMAIAGVFIALKSFEMLVGHIAAKKGGKAA